MSFVHVGDDGVTRSRPRWPWLVAAIVLVLGAGVGTAYVVANDDDDATTTSAPSVSPSPTAADPVTPSPTSAPSPSGAVVPTASVAPTSMPTPVGTPSTTASPAPARAPSATPTATPTRSSGGGFPAKGLTLDVVGEPISGDPPAVRFRIRVRDNDGSEVDGSINFGDGTNQVYSRRPPASCRTTPSSPAPGYRAQPIDKTFTVTHPYEAAGTFTVVVTANTARPCDGTPEENARRTLTVVIPARPTPSPTSAPVIASPTPSPTRSP